MAGREAFGKEPPVLSKERQAGDGIHDIGNQEIAKYGDERFEKLKVFQCCCILVSKKRVAKIGLENIEALDNLEILDNPEGLEALDNPDCLENLEIPVPLRHKHLSDRTIGATDDVDTMLEGIQAITLQVVDFGRRSIEVVVDLFQTFALTK